MVQLKEHTTDDIFSNLIKPLRVERHQDQIVIQAANLWFGRRARDEQGELIKRVIADTTGIPVDQVVFADKPYKAALGAGPLRVEPGTVKHERNPKLDKNYRFETFVSGSSKRIEKAMAMNAANTFTGDMATLVIFGNSGYGKTHLLHAIGHHVFEKYPEKALKVAHSTTFVNEVTSIIKPVGQRSSNINSVMRALQNEYTQNDVILIDDLHHFVGKKKVQEEFLHLLNIWQERQTKLAFTSLGELKELDGLDAALRSRLLGGVAIHAVEPDESVKVQVLLHQAQKDDIDLPHPVAEYLATQLDGDIRVLKGTLLSIARTQSFAKGQPGAITRDIVDDTLAKLNRQRSPMTVENILSAVSEHFKVSVSEIRSSARSRGKLIPRQMGMMLAHELTTLPLTDIATAFGRKDHSTVKNALVALPAKLNKNPDLRRDYDALKKALK